MIILQLLKLQVQTDRNNRVKLRKSEDRHTHLPVKITLSQKDLGHSRIFFVTPCKFGIELLRFTELMLFLHHHGEIEQGRTFDFIRCPALE